MDETIKKLFAPFEPDEIEWRVGATTKDGKKGMMLPYVTNRAIMRRLDTVLGPLGWRDEYVPLHNGVLCKLSVKIGDEWITKEDGADVTKVEPTKGGISDAMKRAAVKFGIGRYLYKAQTTWVELDEYKRPKEQPKLVIKK